MRYHNNSFLFSATDLVNFLGCTHASSLDRDALGSAEDRSPDDPMRELLQQLGIQHEQEYLESLRKTGRSIVEIPAHGDIGERAKATKEAMDSGADIIYQGALFSPPWHGYSDFLQKVDGTTSKLGSYSYEVIDTKLSSTAKPKYVFQLCVYSEMVADVQGRLPDNMHLVLGDKSKVSLRVSDVIHYFRFARSRFGSFQQLESRVTTAEPCGHCTYCKWLERCEAEWESTNHLSRIANISRSQRAHLMDAGITTIVEVASTTIEKVDGIQTATFAKLKAQARLQVPRRAGGAPEFALLPLNEAKGFNRLPKPHPADIFFDMEGDPLYRDGLEYLFGLNHVTPSGETFTSFWAHSRAEEKIAFQKAMDLIIATIDAHPDAHVYHYAAYEESALKRLALIHGTREAEVDRLLRDRKLVDLYKVVREGMQISEPRYSIKNLEVFYGAVRKEEVKSGGDSIIVYETWRRANDGKLLRKIEEYNEFDCKSTRMCRDWLLSIRPSGVEWFAPAKLEPEEAERREEITEAEEETEELREELLEDVDPDDLEWREVLGYLLDFHRREDKSEWWAMFHRMEMEQDQLIDDSTCLGGLVQDASRAPVKEKRSLLHFFTLPPQDTKMRVGDGVLRSDTGKSCGTIFSLDAENGEIALKIGTKGEIPPSPFSIIPQGPRRPVVLQEAVARYASAIAAGKTGMYHAVTSILRKDKPRISGIAEGSAIAKPGADLVSAVTTAVSRLDESHLLIQGPPGTGKTFTSAHAIVQLLKDGKRVGVASNSHKAINNLLEWVEKIAREKRVHFAGVKKGSSDDDTFTGSLIVDTKDNGEAADPKYNLVAGTAWLFSRPEMDQTIDHLFIDEAGQVCLANVVAMGTAAKNIVLVGDQMQLSQPSKGIHPANSGFSALERLLGEHATVPPDRGILLNVTRRLHPSICSFISDAVYEGRLEPYKGTAKRFIVSTKSSSSGIRESGIAFIDVEHEGNAQCSDEEVVAVKAVYSDLLKHKWNDGSGPRPITKGDILVVTPYNMQVNRLKAALPKEARVGTVDKFQGQEAVVVLVSMATSSGEEMPRNIEFLFSRQRLNVAISRAQCLAIVFASPKLLEVSCSSIEQLRLVNTLCWAKEYSAGSGY